MRLNDELHAPTVVHAARMDWTPSPAKGVERRMLYRIGEEKARATSIVRYAPDSRFARHGHPGGEEFVVLEGTFQDEAGDYPAGTYVRNPPGSGHAPGSQSGCVIFVKLWQFRSDDRHEIVKRPGQGDAGPGRGGVTSSRILFDASDECVKLEVWSPDAEIALANTQGLELLVLDGGFVHETEHLERWSWLRLPAGTPLRAQVGAHGARVWYKSAPLQHPAVCVMDDAAPS